MISVERAGGSNFLPVLLPSTFAANGAANGADKGGGAAPAEVSMDGVPVSVSLYSHLIVLPDCSTTVCDAGPTVKQQMFNVLCFLGAVRLI